MKASDLLPGEASLISSVLRLALRFFGKIPFQKDNFESLYWMKHFSFRLAVINVCPVLAPSESLLSTHLPTLEGWTAELTVGLWLVVPTTGFEPTRVDLA